MTAFAQDNFTDADGTVLTNHIGELGASWTIWDFNAGSPGEISGGQLVRGGSGGSCVAYMSGIPPSADYEVSMDFLTTGPLGDGYALGLFARLNPAAHRGYLLQRESWSAGLISLYSAFDGAWNLLERSALSALTRATLRVSGDQIIALVDGDEIFRHTSTDHTDPGRVGVRWDAPGDGYRADNLLAEDGLGQRWPRVHSIRPLDGQEWPRT